MLRRHLLALGLSPLVVACGETPRPAPPPAASAPASATAPPAEAPPAMLTPPGQTPTGREALISIGGVTQHPHAAVQAALVSGYQRAGYRVHFIVEARSFAPFKAKLAELAQEYLTARRELKQVAFHHTGHGWDDHISYQGAAGTSGSSLHSEIAGALGAPFPTTEPLFAATRFGLIYDACGQGKATAQTVPARAGYVATATPDAAPAAACAANNCPYVCVACRDQLVSGYVYSQGFAAALAAPPNEAGVESMMRAAHAAGQAALRAAASPSACTGKFEPF